MKVDTITVGITTQCNSKCFSCDREIFENYLKNENMPIETIEKLIPHCDKFVLIGGFGDVICHPDSLDIIEMLVNNNKGIFFDSNCALHGKEYWTKMGSLMSKDNTLLRFNIESLDDIDLHRKVKTKTVIDNLRFYLGVGGKAVVKIIKFKYNENQIPKMVKLFKGMGIKEVQIQTSRIYESEGGLSAPSGTKMGTLQQLYTINDDMNRPPKKCHWQELKNVYINERGEMHPCCHIDSEMVNLKIKNDKIFNKFVMDRYVGYEYFSDEVVRLYHKCRDEININKSSFDTSYNSEYIQYCYSNFKLIKKCWIHCGMSQEFSDLIVSPKEINL